MAMENSSRRIPRRRIRPVPVARIMEEEEEDWSDYPPSSPDANYAVPLPATPPTTPTSVSRDPSLHVPSAPERALPRSRGMDVADLHCPMEHASPPPRNMDVPDSYCTPKRRPPPFRNTVVPFSPPLENTVVPDLQYIVQRSPSPLENTVVVDSQYIKGYVPFSPTRVSSPPQERPLQASALHRSPERGSHLSKELFASDSDNDENSVMEVPSSPESPIPDPPTVVDYDNQLSVWTEASSYFELLNTAVLHMLNTTLKKCLESRCNGCRINHPSQRQHTCLEQPPEDIFQTDFHGVLDELWNGLFVRTIKYYLKEYGHDTDEDRIYTTAKTLLMFYKAEGSIYARIDRMYDEIGSDEKRLKRLSKLRGRWYIPI